MEKGNSMYSPPQTPVGGGDQFPDNNWEFAAVKREFPETPLCEPMQFARDYATTLNLLSLSQYEDETWAMCHVDSMFGTPDPDDTTSSLMMSFEDDNEDEQFPDMKRPALYSSISEMSDSSATTAPLSPTADGDYGSAPGYNGPPARGVLDQLEMERDSGDTMKTSPELLVARLYVAAENSGNLNTLYCRVITNKIYMYVTKRSIVQILEQYYCLQYPTKWNGMCDKKKKGRRTSLYKMATDLPFQEMLEWWLWAKKRNFVGSEDVVKLLQDNLHWNHPGVLTKLRRGGFSIPYTLENTSRATLDSAVEKGVWVPS
jgi:hypothetical protein